MPVEVEDKDVGFSKLLTELTWLEGKSVTIGWQGASALESPGQTEATIVDIATFNEFGTVTIPERPMMQLVFDEKAGELEAFMEREVQAILDLKRTAKQALNRMGMKAVALLQNKITDSPSWAEPLAQSTIDKKGSTKPLVDSGDMRARVTYAIRDRGRIIDQSEAA